jgi:prepilin-type N-terminal cleavage/methylation domain-containing protein
MRQFSAKHSTAGYTLVEMIVVLVIIGILAAIAAPGWLAFANSRRANAARDQVVQVLRQTQAQARTSKSVQSVTFDTTADPPTITALGVTQPIGQGQLDQGVVKLQAKNGATTISKIEFDANGNIKTPSIDEQQGLKMTVVVNTTAKRCVFIQTLLGATRTASDADCN